MSTDPSQSRAAFCCGSDVWPALCQRIEALTTGQSYLLEPDLPMAASAEAERIAAQLLARTSAASSLSVASRGTKQGEHTDVQAVDVNSLELVRPRSVGVEQLGLWAMQQIGLIDLLIELGVSGPLRAGIVGSIIGRMASPGSEAATHRWLGSQSALGELLDVDYERMPLMTLYRASDALMKHQAVIERVLYDRVHDLFGLETTVTLYDLTNTYFEVAAANPKAKHGRSKEKRHDCPLVTLVGTDGSGFVRRSEILRAMRLRGRRWRICLATWVRLRVRWW
ncbi:hypothetical protein [Nitrosomonas sp.]|uniref:hypothetical protein n=1 Tax=Nitrosomonas sp. TaxID=42353 RepID=UPI00260442A7|nr:hypothetical protein [Nitrosomonas sp.]MCW5601593.1 hypothetical protein [Nitrosomonas sp.]